MNITIRNDFHRTSATVRAVETQIRRRTFTFDGVTETQTAVYLSPAQTRRAARKLCPCKDCSCGTIRGEQPDPSTFVVFAVV